MNAASNATDAKTRIRRIARASEWAISLAILLFGLALALMCAIAIFFPPLLEEWATSEIDLVAGKDLSGIHGALMIAALVSCAPGGLLIYALIRGRRLLAGYRRGEIFTPRAAQHVSLIGWMLVAMTPACILAGACSVAIVTHALDPAAGAFDIDIDDGDLMQVVFGLMLVAIGRVLGEASRLAAENDAFV